MARRRQGKVHVEFLKPYRPHYETILRQQGGVCAICERKPSARRRLDMDHNHRLFTFRGLLCARCNRALPTWMTPEWLRAAALYLERQPVYLHSFTNQPEESK